jgi:hypothetical protein
MTERDSFRAGRDYPRRTAFWVAATTALLAAAALVAGITTPPRSGAFCRGECVTYPYTDVVAFVPRDYWWMYPGLLLALAAVLLAVCLRPLAAPRHDVLAAAAVCLTAIGAAVLVVDYGVQLTVVQPALLAGETDGLSLWSPYNPHGLFLALENIGYAVLAAAMLLLGIALRPRVRLLRMAGWVFTVGGALSLAALVALAAIYGVDLDVRYEVTAIVITWLVLLTTGTLLAVELARTHPPDRGPAAGVDRPRITEPTR